MAAATPAPALLSDNKEKVSRIINLFVQRLGTTGARLTRDPHNLINCFKRSQNRKITLAETSDPPARKKRNVPPEKNPYLKYLKSLEMELKAGKKAKTTAQAPLESEELVSLWYAM